ncbi:hypothetical protein IP88_01790 [alpha proteobacterium AAP81b]|nr:hypothetical protein IP88_01790 [alpha proteobacterium AAP81b]
MTDAPILSKAEARKRFFLYFGLKLVGLVALFAAVFVSRDGLTLVGGLLLAVGGASLFVRPRHLGLTTTPPPPPK